MRANLYSLLSSLGFALTLMPGCVTEEADELSFAEAVEPGGYISDTWPAEHQCVPNSERTAQDDYSSFGEAGNESARDQEQGGGAAGAGGGAGGGTSGGYGDGEYEDDGLGPEEEWGAGGGYGGGGGGYYEGGQGGGYEEWGGEGGGTPSAPDADVPDDPCAEGDIDMDAGVGEQCGDAGLETEEPVEKTNENPFVDPQVDPMSTFSIDVDTASYTAARMMLNACRLPAPSSVRVEEFINFFRYTYDAPAPGDAHPFSVEMEASPSPFGEGLHMLRIGLQSEQIPQAERAPVNLVFLIDTSGSMGDPLKLGLVKHALKLLTARLMPSDSLAIVTYAGTSDTLMPPTPVAERGTIYETIDQLEAHGSTGGAGALEEAYGLAEAAFRPDGVNRVVLATDGDFNVGLTGMPLVEEVVSWRDRAGIYLSVLGFGMGFNDPFLEELTNQADGNYSFIDSRKEAVRVLGTHLVSTLQVIARDVKIQVEFSPEWVKRFRLVGYDNRRLANREFRDDTVDAGEIGAGHQVTALYELELDPKKGAAHPNEALAEVRFRYKSPDAGHRDTATEFSTTFLASDIPQRLEQASDDHRFALAVAEFAEILRLSHHSDGERFPDVHGVATGATRSRQSDRIEMLRLVKDAHDLWNR